MLKRNEINPQYEYISYEKNAMNTYGCIYIVLSERAYKSILAETFTHGNRETGGILLGHFVNKIWYIIEVIDPGLITVNNSTYFEFDIEYVNHRMRTINRLYNYPLTILGVWHRHPGSMDTFSTTDISSIHTHVSESQNGILSMLVNVDPELRMTFYYCSKECTLMKVPYDVGDNVIIKDIIVLADERKIQENIGTGKVVRIVQKNNLPKKRMPLSIGQDPIPIIGKIL